MACVVGLFGGSAAFFSGISKPVIWATRGLHPGFPWFSSFSWFL